MEIKKGFKYTAHHVPSGEDWVLLGLSNERNLVCVAGWPPTEAKLSDCQNFEQVEELHDHEKSYRFHEFGGNWDN